MSNGGAKLRGPELVAEARHLSDGGLHPEEVAVQLGRSVPAIEAAARRVGDVELSVEFMRAMSAMRRFARDGSLV